VCHLLLTLSSFILLTKYSLCFVFGMVLWVLAPVELHCFVLRWVLCFCAGWRPALVEATWKHRVPGEFCATRDVTLNDLSVSGNWDLFLDRIYVIPGGQQVLCVWTAYGIHVLWVLRNG
jgi:hypothetical protein